MQINSEFKQVLIGDLVFLNLEIEWVSITNFSYNDNFIFEPTLITNGPIYVYETEIDAFDTRKGYSVKNSQTSICYIVSAIRFIRKSIIATDSFITELGDIRPLFHEYNFHYDSLNLNWKRITNCPTSVDGLIEKFKKRYNHRDSSLAVISVEDCIYDRKANKKFLEVENLKTLFEEHKGCYVEYVKWELTDMNTGKKLMIISNPSSISGNYFSRVISSETQSSQIKPQGLIVNHQYESQH
jgi:hypothetical protein